MQDARLVALNAQDAAQRGASIMTRCKVTAAVCITDDAGQHVWQIELQDALTLSQQTVYAKALVNATGPWINQVIDQQLSTQSEHKIRLVRGSHIVVNKLFEHDRAYFFQSSDQRIAFAIPYEQNYTLIGTTDQDHPQTADDVICSQAEVDYLLALANEYFDSPVTQADMVWTYSGVRPLFDDGASKSSEATRDYVVSLQQQLGAPLVNIFGGKITTYRKLAEATLAKLEAQFPHMGSPWTQHAPLPGGDFLLEHKAQIKQQLLQQYSFLSADWAQRLINTYGTNANNILGTASCSDDEKEIVDIFDRKIYTLDESLKWCNL
ncbi:MAG TPA: glycerol-3-phosphate dehydrogenase, partial [Oceanospirillaceae bacterium]|nr:glycerol-3-phosphate dehydrogenase [Oceanospirillaceae bacterium]